MISFGNTGGIVATFSFLATDASRYTKGYTVCLAVTMVGLLAAVTYSFLIWRENRKPKTAGEQGRVTLLTL